MSWDFTADTTIDKPVLDKCWDKITAFIRREYSNTFTKNVEIYFGNGFLLGVTPKGDVYVGNCVDSFITGEGLKTRLEEFQRKKKNDAGLSHILDRLKKNANNKDMYYETIEQIVRNWKAYKEALEREAAFYKDFEV